MHGMLTPVCIHLRIQTGNRAHSRTSGISSACQAIKPMSSPASVPHSRRAAPELNGAVLAAPKDICAGHSVGAVGGPLAKSSRSTSITPDSPAKLRQTIPRFTRLGLWRSPEGAERSLLPGVPSAIPRKPRPRPREPPSLALFPPLLATEVAGHATVVSDPVGGQVE